MTSTVAENAYLSQFLVGSAKQTTATDASSESDESSNELGQDAFLELMIAQMKNQSPLDPQDNGEFVAQLAQFSSVESLDKLNNNFESFSGSFLSNQALEASSLVGRSVTVSGDKGELDSSGVVSGVATIPASSTDISIEIYNQAGVLLEDISVGGQPQGEMNFRWNGEQVEINGELLDWNSSRTDISQGVYQFKVSGTIDGKNEQYDTALSANVNSVTLGVGSAVTLNLSGLGAVSMADVKQIN